MDHSVTVGLRDKGPGEDSLPEETVTWSLVACVEAAPAGVLTKTVSLSQQPQWRTDDLQECELPHLKTVQGRKTSREMFISVRDLKCTARGKHPHDHPSKKITSFTCFITWQ